MHSLKNKKILLGVSGGIAAYKTPELVRLLVKSGAEVQVIMTPNAHRFVTAETLSTVSKKPVHTDFFKDELGQWTNHVELGLWADFFLIAPATASTLGKMAKGISDNLLIATYLSSRCKVAVSPAMDMDMLQSAATNRNLEVLKKDGVLVIPPASGELASGLYGPGRMPEPSEIFDFVLKYLQPQLLFSGKKVLVTAGPTYENLDPVRFIGNHSSGKMGYAIAETFAKLGADVHLVSGPVHLSPPENCAITKVESAEEMLQACRIQSNSADIIIMAAAVADYSPKTKAENKIKKKEETFSLELIKTTDILSELSANRKPNQHIIGFALETENALEYARKKLENKNLDMVVMNTLEDSGAGFGTDTNKVTLVFRDREQELELKSKTEIADDIANALYQMMNKNN
ncbi:MAG: bifunctional phosphopantothenoylcysteine decarboxylase/phosphopantothenate--cysteine ligase CoaBC [Bacteroidetes bacterium]|nr:bifunctional phosphopantothenoylcysteine decarboxylase/phosphopantothenate--cysteine ligase CoaBC [Bacteroidota bacterium]